MADRLSPEDQLDRAAALVREAVRQSGDGGGAELDRETLVAAVAADLATLSGTAGRDEERLAKVEAQTQVLAEAVIAIAKVSDGIAPTIKAVKAEM
jgi:hypothetical protein